MTGLFRRGKPVESPQKLTLDLLEQGLCTTDQHLRLTGTPNRAFTRLFGSLALGADLGSTVFSGWSEAQVAELRESVARILSSAASELRVHGAGGSGELVILGSTRADVRYCEVALARLADDPAAPVLWQFREVTATRRQRDEQERLRLRWEEQAQRVRQLLDRERSEVQGFVALFTATVESAAQVVREWSTRGAVTGVPGEILPAVGRLRLVAEQRGFTGAADRTRRLEQSLRAVFEEGLDLERHLQVVGDYEALAEEKRQFERMMGRLGDLTPAVALHRDAAELDLLVRQTVRQTCAASGKEAELLFRTDVGPLNQRQFEALRQGLLPLVHNAVHHGIELSEVRAAVGKPVPGRVEVRLLAEGTRMRLVVRDDGRGFDWPALQARLEARSVLPAGAGSEEVVRSLLVGGLGSGLAAARKALVKDLGGRISLKSAPGRGVHLEVVFG